MPGLVKQSLGSGDFRWLLHTHGIRDAVTTGMADVSTFTKADHYPDGFFRSGTIVNCADPKALKPFTGAAGEKLGFIFGDFETNGVEDRAVTVLFHGSIRTNFLPVKTNLPTTAPAGFYFTAGA